MNRKMILRVADAIEDAAKPEAEPKIGFNMQVVRAASDTLVPDLTGHHCETVACIAGWAISIEEKFSSESFIPSFNGNWVERGADILGISEVEAKALFDPRNIRDVHDATPLQAVTVLRHLAETGKVDWSVVLEDRP